MYRILRKYNLSAEDYRLLIEIQNGLCGICGNEPGERGWQIDHDHSCCEGEKSCGECVRGLLCFNCNIGIGYLKENIAILQNAIHYLKKKAVIAA
jgi:hypothetical protein